jgi:hypothetical protein
MQPTEPVSHCALAETGMQFVGKYNTLSRWSTPGLKEENTWIAKDSDIKCCRSVAYVSEGAPSKIYILLLHKNQDAVEQNHVIWTNLRAIIYPVEILAASHSQSCNRIKWLWLTFCQMISP